MDRYRPTRILSMFALTILVAGKGYCEGVPDRMELSRGIAVAMALRKNPDLRVDVLNASMAETDIARSRGIYDPLFSLSGNGGVLSVPGDPFFSTKSATTSIGLTQFLPTGGSASASVQSGFTDAEISGATSSTDWQSSVGLTLSQPLLKNAGKETMELSITLATNSHQDSLERHRFVIIDTAHSVITSYNHLYTLRQGLEARVAALDSTLALLDELRKREKPGALHAMEIANAEYAVAQRRRDLVEAERTVRDQEAGLRYLIGMESRSQIIPIDPPSRDEPQETEDQAVKLALENRPDLKQLQLALQASQLQERVARHQTLPELSVTASGGLTGTGGSFGKSFRQIGDRPSTFWSAGMQFSVPIGNTFAKSDYLRSKIRSEQVQNQLSAQAWKIRNEVESDMRALISARLQLQTADKSRQYAEQRLEEYRKQNRIGSATVQDVINAENDLTSARNSQLDAVETFANTVAKLQRDTGMLLERQNIRIEAPEGEKATPEEKPVLTPPPASGGALPLYSGTPTVAPQEPPRGKESAGPTGDDAGKKTAEAKDKPPVPKTERTEAAGSADETAAATGTYTLMVGEYATPSALAEAKEKIRKAGLLPVVNPGPERKEPMTRLLVGEFPDQKSARKELDRVRRAKADGFIITKGKHRYCVYAGSYARQAHAVELQKRLAASGIKSSLEITSISTTTFLLTAGNFPTREAAQRDAGKLEKEGIRPVVIKSSSPDSSITSRNFSTS